MSDAKATKAVTALTRGENELRKLLVAKGEKDLYQHVTKVCSHIVRHQPHNALDKLEEVSFLMKDKNGENLEKYLKTGINKDYASPSDDSARDSTKPFIASTRQYFPVSLLFIRLIINFICFICKERGR